MSYLHNAWYVAGWSGDLLERPIGRKYLGEQIVLYRDEQGVPVALAGRCPHRFAPLHLGTVEGGAIECGYHGLRFGKDGRCIHNPHGDGSIPSAADLRTFKVVERDGVIWLWMGNPDEADESLIIDTKILVPGHGYTFVYGYLHVAANYQLVIDNLLDLTHAAYIHRGGLSSEELAGDNQKHRFWQKDTSIHSDYNFLNVNPPPQLKAFWPDGRADIRAFMHLTMPSTLHLDFRMGEVDGDPDRGAFLPTFHLIAPETENSTHYFFALGRNVDLENEELTQLMGALTRRAFAEEDEPMIRACREMMETNDLFSLNPVLLKTDVAAVRARLLLDKLIRQEQGVASDLSEKTAEPA